MELRELRIKFGWCQSELAKKLNTTLEAIQEIEEGRKQPSPEQKLILDRLFFESELSSLDIIQSSHNDAQKNLSG
ncbi:MAG: helix-turn-helix transcriptional regulator [Bdellovibrionaceae bacterium]|nr:helix-turn-helix transcriptional regulator [Pseudobdellovibrionaceae bacterium]MDW8189876.1 helix-turn-helix transcriptional regulator [Pseudobdellovibrionaceae bacterium]